VAKINVAGGARIEMRVERLRGLQVRLRREVRTGAAVYPAGTVCTVYTVWRSGVNVDAPACGHCGITVHIRQLHRDDIELLEVPRDAAQSDSATAK
jgi:hypothetical protein